MCERGRRCWLEAGGVAALAAALPELRALALGGNRLGHAGVRAIVEADAWPWLEVLELGYSDLDDDAVATLLDWPRVAQLRILSLHTNQLTPLTSERLRQVPFSRIERIDAWQTDMTPIDNLPLSFSLHNLGMGSRWHRARFAAP